MTTNNSINLPTGALNTVVLGQGIGSAFTSSTATYPATTTINQLLYSSAANTIVGLATGNDGVLVTGNTGIPSILAGPGTTGQILQANAAAAPSFSTASYPSTTTINQVLYSSGANVVAGLATLANGVLITGGGGVPAISQTLPSAVQGNITSTGTISSGVWNGTPIALAFGGTNANLTASNGGIFYSTATAGAILAGTATANQVLLSGTSAAPAWSTATYPATTTVSQILYSSATNTITGLATANRAVLTTGTTGIPVLTALATDGQVIVGSTAGSPAAATLTAGAGITITNASNSITVATTAGVNNSFCQGRLTLTSGSPVTTADVTAATTVYFTPYKGNYITLYTGATWTTYTFSEISVAVPGTTDTMYDIFAYDSGGNVTLETVAWTNTTTRATALVFQNGVYCKTGALDRRYVGSFCTTGVSGQTEDSILKRYLYNYYNRVSRNTKVIDNTATWNYTLLAFRQARASTANQVQYVVGVGEDAATAKVLAAVFNTSSPVVVVGVGINSTTVNSAAVGGAQPVAAGSSVTTTSYYNGILPVGRTTLAWLESSGAAGTSTWIGASGNLQSGLEAELLM